MKATSWRRIEAFVLHSPTQIYPQTWCDALQAATNNAPTKKGAPSYLAIPHWGWEENRAFVPKRPLYKLSTVCCVDSCLHVSNKEPVLTGRTSVSQSLFLFAFAFLTYQWIPSFRCIKVPSFVQKIAGILPVNWRSGNNKKRA